MKDAGIRAALHGAAASLPHLSGLSRLVKVSEDRRVATAAVTASGRLLVNPEWFGALPFADRVFVVAHEMMHLALRSHERGGVEDARLFNVAHDLIINDMLSRALGTPVPADGLYEPGAAETSAERIVADLKRREASGASSYRSFWRRPETSLGPLGAALVRAGVNSGPRSEFEPDVMDAEAERRMFPDATRDASAAARIAAAAERAIALDVWFDRTRAAFEAALEARTATRFSGVGERLYKVLDSYHAPPWEVALQRWLDDAGPPTRSYRRASRRQGERDDIVLAGRVREGWTLNVVLDTSGSMLDDGDSAGPVTRALAAIKGFCVGANVGRLRIVQGGMDVEADDVIDLRDLDRFRIRGGGGSDLAPSLRKLAADPEVEAVIVITDGYIRFPDERMPYEVLWALTERERPDNFDPSYGRIVILEDI